MKTLSIRQPWASLIVHGIKPVENRTWKHLPKAEPQWLVIHSSQKPECDAATFVRDGYQIEAVPLGAIVGAAFWSGSYDRKTCPKKLWRSEWINHDCNVFLVFDRAIMIKPYPAKGRLGFWTCPEEAEKRIQEAIRCGH